MKYREEFDATIPTRTEYRDSIYRLMERRKADLSEKRKAKASRIFTDPEGAHQEFREMLGWPLSEEPQMPRKVEKTLLSREDGDVLYRLSFEIFEDFWFYGLLFEHEGQTLPLVVSQHGGAGTAELCSGLYGYTANYNDMSTRCFEKGVHVFAPQLLTWNATAYQVSFDKQDVDVHMKQLGGCSAAIEVYCLRCCIRWLDAQSFVETGKLGMVGLSYGGFYTLFTAAAEPKIKAAVSAGFFNDRTIHAWYDWVYFRAAEKFLDSEVALLVYPRKLWLYLGDRDELFGADTARAEYARLEEEAKASGIPLDWVHFEIFDGNHEFPKFDDGIDGVIAELKKA